MKLLGLIFVVCWLGVAVRAQPKVAPKESADTKVRVSHNHGTGGCEGYLIIDAKGYRYEDTIRPGIGMTGTHAFRGAWKDLAKYEFEDNTDHHSQSSPQLWLFLWAKGATEDQYLGFSFEPATREGPTEDARQDFVRAEAAFRRWHK